MAEILSDPSPPHAGIWAPSNRPNFDARRRRPRHARGRLATSPWRVERHTPMARPYPTRRHDTTSRQRRGHVPHTGPEFWDVLHRGWKRADDTLLYEQLKACRMEIGLDLAEVDFSCLSPSSSRGLGPVTRHPQPRVPSAHPLLLFSKSAERVVSDAERLERAGAHRARKGLPHPSPALRRPGSGLPSPKRDRRKIVRAPGALIPPNLPTFARIQHLPPIPSSSSLSLPRPLSALLTVALPTGFPALLGMSTIWTTLSPSRHASTHFERAPSIDTKRIFAMLTHPHNVAGSLVVSGAFGINGKPPGPRRQDCISGGVVIQAGGEREGDGLDDLRPYTPHQATGQRQRGAV
ncbi:uncharacterized protein SCHCODRAFT_01088652 [Schizophyllum commune H4-8]|nr:uncharacterized protein SCHCODRAFT_01088652 [Schizophyllum commune H4-8]KAI5895645.1 hypothetical protein SCHCODRAFT_01088652 [Schizophyllum commune H4-8]